MAKSVERLTCNLSADLMTRVDEYAERMHINRTSAVAVLLTQALDNMQTVKTMDELLKAYNELKEKEQS